MVRAVFCSALSLGEDEDVADIYEIRCQLAEQLRCLETRTETQTSILLELNDYYRRKAEIDMEYGKQLEKLARSAMQRHKNEKNKRECWSMHSICALWQQLVDNTREEARERNEIAELYITQLTTLISQRCDDLHKISRKCREIGSLAHGEVSRVLNELHTAMKTYQLCFTEYSSVESKYRQVEENKLKYEEENPKKRGATRKHRSLTKLFDKRLEKYDIVRVKCLKARNEYLLCVQAANAALHKYFADDLSDLIDCMDLGMEEWLRSLITCTVSSRKTICQKEMDHLADLYSFKQSLDAKADKQRFFEANHATFMLPKRFEFRGQIGDAMSTVSAAEGVAEELQQRQMQIERRLTNVRLESEEIWKSLESTERAVIEKNAELMRSADVNEQRKDSSAQTELVIDHLKNRNDLNELYDYYLNKFSHYLLNSNLIERLEARSNGIGNALSDFTAIATLQKGADESFTHSTITPNRGVTEENDNKMLLSSCNTTICSSSSVTATAAHSQHATKRKKRIGGGIVKNDETKRPRLFGGSLDEYVDATVAGVLKLYLRELREPLFPIFLFDQLTECAKCINPEEFIKQVSPLLEKLSQPTLLVLRYLFAFLNHLSEFSDENMMDPYNLAICFGPTLLPIPEGKDQVFYHNFVNELVKNLIVYHENVFSALLPGPSYEKYLLESCDNALYIDDQEAVISGDEEISSTTAMFDSCCIERLPSIGETDYSSVNSNCNNTPTAADALHPSDVHVLSNNTPHINSRTSLSSATAVTATTTTTHVPASTIPITTGN
ncbi:unnamed protein product [Anisakis simplex]|uniref:SLIT-ROBO Rho GTPase-activating protein 1 n=1 Tax=Anisakis simplex TaxID=6269 RepID=A0A158PPH2_ANISI|nr:unnamed protein product [Anisakis simplex]